MTYKVSVAGFEGPFDLLLQLVLQQKVDIGTVSVAAVADQYLAEVARLEDVDLEVASDFVFVASTLLDLKAEALFDADNHPEETDADEEEFEDLTADEMRDVLVARLMAYRTFKMASKSLEARGELEERVHPRTIGPLDVLDECTFDGLEGVELKQLAALCARFLGRRELVLLQSEHIAPKRLPLEDRVSQVNEEVRSKGCLTFEELVEDNPSVENKVVSILALLELGKRNVVELEQLSLFGTITIRSHHSDMPEGANSLATVG